MPFVVDREKARELSAPLKTVLALPLASNWEMACTTGEVWPARLDGLHFLPAAVPGTVASNLRAQNAWKPGERRAFDSEQWCFRCRFTAQPCESGEEVSLVLGGIATLARVWLNGSLLLDSQSMFARHEVNISALLEKQNEVVIVCRALEPALRNARTRKPAARWRTQVVAEQQMRWFRTTLLGRAPGFAPEPQPVGPWRPVTLVRRRELVVDSRSRNVSFERGVGSIRIELNLRSLNPAAQPVSGRLISGEWRSPLTFEHSDHQHLARAVLQIPNAERWWPHTHGEPKLYPLRAELQLAGGLNAVFEDSPVGFRTIEGGLDPDENKDFHLTLSGKSIFCRGVVWTPPDIVSLAQSSEATYDRLRLLRDGGFNLIRLAGTTVYEDDLFHTACDELGLLVWQDMMFANMDYPFADPSFQQAVLAETKIELLRLARHASTAVICGNSEIEQQVGMLGLDQSLGRGSFFGDELPQLVRKYCPGVPYLPSAPCGGDLPFRTNRGVANYFGVGAYLRPLNDARRAELRFASECLAFANVPEPEMLQLLSLATRGEISPGSASWKQSVPRDGGAGWDFEDVRDYYLKLLFSIDAVTLRYSDANRYWELSRMVSGEVMADTFGEWRRPASPCNGAIILWSADLQPGGGWGILDATGSPKAPYWFLKRALSPCAVWMTDEGLNGLDIHVANDGPTVLRAKLRIAMYRNREHRIEESAISVDLPPHESRTFGLEQILRRFVDASYAYRFGPLGYDLAVASLHRDSEEIPIAQSFFLPSGRSPERMPIGDLGLTGESKLLSNGYLETVIRCRRFAYGVKVFAAGFLPDDAYFSMEPGGVRRIVLTPTEPKKAPARLAVTAINAEGSFPICVERLL
ncbi:MAG TPA: hypothetical protein VHZ55_10480 [Bryobacteraceae bacterium]|nr:hypothetical protein [Bryobacteraceae bacterium]